MNMQLLFASMTFSIPLPFFSTSFPFIGINKATGHHFSFCSGSLESWDHEVFCCCCFLQILLVILSSSPEFGPSSPSRLIQPHFGTHWCQISLPSPSRPLARARTLHSSCRTPTPGQGGKFLPKYDRYSGSHSWLPDCRRLY